MHSSFTRTWRHSARLTVHWNEWMTENAPLRISKDSSRQPVQATGQWWDSAAPTFSFLWIFILRTNNWLWRIILQNISLSRFGCVLPHIIFWQCINQWEALGVQHRLLGYSLHTELQHWLPEARHRGINLPKAANRLAAPLVFHGSLYHNGNCASESGW